MFFSKKNHSGGRSGKPFPSLKIPAPLTVDILKCKFFHETVSTGHFFVFLAEHDHHMGNCAKIAMPWYPTDPEARLTLAGALVDQHFSSIGADTSGRGKEVAQGVNLFVYAMFCRADINHSALKLNSLLTSATAHFIRGSFTSSMQISIRRAHSDLISFTVHATLDSFGIQTFAGNFPS